MSGSVSSSSNKFELTILMPLSVSAGTIVTAKVAGKEQVFALGGQEITEDVPDGVKVFSPDAPLGQALMGHRAGDTVSYEAPNGRKIQAEIVKVERV